MHKTIRTPAIINIIFFYLIIIGALALSLTYIITEAKSASPLDSYCERQFEQSMRYKISPLAYKKCQSRFDIKTNEWMTWNYTK